jgi:hypothetical protein
MEKLDNLVARYIEDRLLDPERLEEVLAYVLNRRQERSERRHEHIAELNKRAAETDLRLKRLYDSIELADPALKERIAGLKAIRDQAQADAGRAQALLEGSGRGRPLPRPWSASSPGRPANGSGSTVAAIAATVSAPSPSGLRSRTARFATRTTIRRRSVDRRPIKARR